MAIANPSRCPELSGALARTRVQMTPWAARMIFKAQPQKQERWLNRLHLPLRNLAVQHLQNEAGQSKNKHWRFVDNTHGADRLVDQRPDLHPAVLFRGKAQHSGHSERASSSPAFCEFG